MWVRLTACLVWALLALSAVFWAFKLLVRPAGVPAHALPVAVEQAARGDPLRLFAAPQPVVAAAAPPPTSSRFKLLGVMAPNPADDGVAAGLALIAVDGKPARAYPVGAPVDGEWVLQAVSARTASIGPQGGAVAAQLEVPALPAAATGTLPAAGQDLLSVEVEPVPPTPQTASPPRPGPVGGRPRAQPGSLPGGKGNPAAR
jgi:general secretion pathway protein C